MDLISFLEIIKILHLQIYYILTLEQTVQIMIQLQKPYTQALLKD